MTAPTSARPWGWTLPFKTRVHPEAGDWAPACGWAWLGDLDPRLRPAARLLAYLCTRIYAAGPVQMLAFTDVPDPDQAVTAALTGAGLITVHPHPSGLRRWQRPE